MRARFLIFIILLLLLVPSLSFASDTLYENYMTGYDGNDRIDHTTYYFAQTFTPSISHTITSIKVILHTIGTISSGTLTASIRATDTNGKPTGSDMGAGTLDASTIASSETTYEISISAGAIALASTKYALVLRSTGVSGTNYIAWSEDESSPTYSGGSRAVSTDSGATWSLDTNTDRMFAEYGTLYTPPPPPDTTTDDEKLAIYSLAVLSFFLTLITTLLIFK